MGILESTARTRELGNELKRRRKAAGLRNGDLATRLQWSTTKISRIETGQRAADEIDVVFYLAHLGAPGRAGLQIFGPQFAPPPGAEGAAGGQACGVVGPGSPRRPAPEAPGGEAWAGQKVTWREWFPVV